MSMTIFRIGVGLLGLVTLATGVQALFTPSDWFFGTGDVSGTGPFNAHFVRDVGNAYLGLSASFLIAAAMPRWAFPALIPGLVFSLGHAGVHGWEIATGHAATHGGSLTDWAGVILPAVLTVGLVLWAWRILNEQP